jgi:hypothetical protein
MSEPLCLSFRHKPFHKPFQKRLERKLFQKKFDQKRMESENDIIGVINRRNGFGATQAFSKKA